MPRQGTEKAATDVLSPEEMRAALDSLPAAELIRLGRIARRYSGLTSLEPDDLLQEAVVRALDGTRRCPREVNVSAFVIGIMKSLASAGRKSVAVARTEGIDGEAVMPAVGAHVVNPGPTPEDVIDQAHRRKQIDALFYLFRDDPDALLGLMAWMDTETIAEAQEATGFDATRMNTVRRRIRRTVERSYPRGLRP